MPKRKTLKTKNMLVCSIVPTYLKDFENEEEKANTVYSLVTYAEELYRGISQNPEKNFNGKFDFDVEFKFNSIVISKKVVGKSIENKELNAFLTYIAILQMVFIDECIYSKGVIDVLTVLCEKNILLSEDYENVCNSSKSISTAMIKLNNIPLNSNDYTVSLKNLEGLYLNFIPLVYRYSPFKEEKGNMMRHIITPTKEIYNENSEFLSAFAEYCNSYCKSHKYSIKIS